MGGHWSGWENMAQAACGIMVDHGPPDKPMHCPYGFLTDYCTGVMGAIGVLVALQQRSRVGGAHMVEVSLARVGMWIQDAGIDDAYAPCLPDIVAQTKKV